MLSNTMNVVSFGNAGIGKSKVLSHVFQSYEEAQTNPLFPSFSGGKSCTQKITSITKPIYGTVTNVNLIDTPGGFALDKPLDNWLTDLKDLPKNFDCLLWTINVEQRVQPADKFTADAMSKLFDNFKFESVIICFTHCDQLDNDLIGPEQKAKEWMNLLNGYLILKVLQNNVLLFGLTKDDKKNYCPSNFRVNFPKSISSIVKGNNLSFNGNSNKNELFQKATNIITPTISNEYNIQLENERQNQERIRQEKRQAQEERKKIVYFDHYITKYVEPDNDPPCRLI